LSAEPWPAGFGRLILEELDSTNAEALRRAPRLDRPTWILARRQTAGRGRRARAWASPPGNLHATLALRPEGAPERVALLSFVAALALHEALAGCLDGRASLALKWPNDVLLNGGKVAGILLEATGLGTPAAALAVGFGVNLAAAPDPAELEPGALRPVSVLGETGLALSPEAVLDRLAAAWAAEAGRFRDEGFAPVRARWLARAARLGETVTARTGRATIRGRFETVDGAGALVVDTEEGTVAVPAADVFF
jgi:BirA family biotin operon repressor/biotin-[acetyl-CoA-carboxylase] ligase